MVDVEFGVLLFDLIGVYEAGLRGETTSERPNHETRLTGVVEYGSSSAFRMLVSYAVAKVKAPRICFMWMLSLNNTLQGRGVIS